MDVMLTDVLVIERGSSLLADAAAGASVLTVEDPTNFGDSAADEGVLELGGLRYNYAGVDPDTGAITLASPLTEAVTTGDPVWVVAGDQVATDWSALCDGGEGENMEASLPFEFRALLPEGHYDPPVPVTITDEPNPKVIAADGRRPVIPVEYVDRATSQEQLDARVTAEIAAVNAAVQADLTAVNATIAAGDSENAQAIDAAVTDLQAQIMAADVPMRTTTDPSGTVPAAGKIWEKYDTLAAGTQPKLLAAWRSDGTAWQPVSLAPTYLPLVNINTGTVGTLAVQRLAVTDFTDYVRDADFKFEGNWKTGRAEGVEPGTTAVPLSLTTEQYGWQMLGGAGLGRTQASNGAGVRSPSSLPYISEPVFRVNPGEVYRVTGGLRLWDAFGGVASGTWVVRLAFYGSDGVSPVGSPPYAQDAGDVASLPLGQLWHDTAFDAVIPAGAAVAQVQLFLVGASGYNYVIFDQVHVRRKMGGELIVDGSIRTKHLYTDFVETLLLTGKVLQTDAAANRGIKISNSGLVAYDAAGVATFSVNPSTGSVAMKGTATAAGTITGAAIVGSSFATATGFGDITITPGNSSANPAALEFWPMRSAIDVSAGNRPSITVYTGSGGSGTTDLAAIRLLGPKVTSGTTRPRIDIEIQRLVGTGNQPIVANVVYHAGGQYGGVGRHYFNIDDIQRAWIDATGIGAPNLTGGATGAVYATTTGALTRSSSSERYKRDIEPMTLEQAQTALAVDAVTFNWRDTETLGPQREPGFIAEQADEVGADLWVYRDTEGRPTSYRYAEMVPAHNVLIRDLYARIEALEATRG